MVWEERWHPLREEWVVVAAHRQNRPWNGETVEREESALPDHLPDCYLCPGATRVSGKRNDGYKSTFVFDNDHPCVGLDAPGNLDAPPGVYRNRPATGVARVVCYSPRHNLTLAELETAEIVNLMRVWQEQYVELGAREEINHVLIFENKGEVVGVSNPHPHCQIYATNFVFKTIETAEIVNLMRVWQEQYVELGAREEIHHVLIFENKGEVVGVSNPHPHCQIYATNFVFKTIETEARVSERHLAETGRILFQDILKAEREDGRRIIFENESAIVFLPYFARYAYEVFVAPKASHPSIAALSEAELRDFAEALKRLLVKFDNLWRTPFPYVMPLHQAPTDGGDHRGFHFHIEFHPPLRRPNLLKYLAGPEIGGGNFLSDTSPEEKAAELRAQPEIHYKQLR